MKPSSLIGQRHAKWSSAAAEGVLFSPFKQFYGAANVVIGGLHIAVQQTELTSLLMIGIIVEK
jgi:hypothetical protein